MDEAEHPQKTGDAEDQDLSIVIELTKDTGGDHTAKVYDGLPEEGNEPTVKGPDTVQVEQKSTQLWLVLKPAANDRGGYVLEVYDAAPTESDQPVACASLPRLDYDRLGKALARLLDRQEPSPQPMADYLIEWLFAGLSACWCKTYSRLPHCRQSTSTPTLFRIHLILPRLFPATR